MTISESFVQQVVLLLIAAAVTGFGLPYVLRLVDNRKLRQQKQFEAELARQNKLIEAQSALLDEITRLVWGWRYLAKQVVYYGTGDDTDRYAAASAAYEERVWKMLDGFRTEISKSRRLVSETAFRELNALYEYIVGDIDRKVGEFAGKPEINRKACAELSTRFTDEVSARLDDALFKLASELRLTSHSVGV
ncbi:MAG TPA: hypothetical protein VFX38_06725 [Gammaproteobacteria bacterium]|nr:hypothetical protein [Gammaproteobacteria bacterium]